jgi:hypothetical protein
MPIVWRNWSGRVEAGLARVESPASTGEVAAAVRRAAGDGLTVKAVCSGHSFSEIAVTDGVQLRLDRLDRVLALDTGTGLVTVQGGIALRRRNPVLAAAGLAMTNLGDIDAQTVTGAVSTGAHGTALAKTGTRLPGDAERRPIGRVAALADEMLSNTVFGALMRAGSVAPRVGGPLRHTGPDHPHDWSPPDPPGRFRP